MAGTGKNRQDRPKCPQGAVGVVGRRQLGGKHRRILRAALGPRHAHQCLRQGIDAGPVGIGASSAIAGKVGLDQAWIYGWADAHALGRAGPQIGQQGIGRGRDALDDLLAGGTARVHRDGAFIEVQVIEISPPDGPGQIAPQWFQLNYVGAQIGQKPSPGRPRDKIGDFQNTDTRQRRWIRLAGICCRGRLHRIQMNGGCLCGSGPLNSARRFAKDNRHAHLHHRAKCGVLHGDHHLVVDHLWVGHAVLGLLRGREGHVRGLKRRNPFGAGSAGDHTGHNVSQFCLVRRRLTTGALREPWFRDQLANPHQFRRDGDEAHMHATQLHPFTIGTFVDAVEWCAARGVCLKFMRLEAFRDDLGVIEQRAGHQRGFDRAAAPGLLAGQQGGGNAQTGQHRRADVGQGVH